jgi:hypothetical protein
MRAQRQLEQDFMMVLLQILEQPAAISGCGLWATEAGMRVARVLADRGPLYISRHVEFGTLWVQITPACELFLCS